MTYAVPLEPVRAVDLLRSLKDDEDRRAWCGLLVQKKGVQGTVWLESASVNASKLVAAPIVGCCLHLW